MPYTSTALTGRQGEDAAVGWLRANGYLLHERNWRNGRYEIDIVAEKQGVIHIVEVKTRRAGGIVSPEQSITPAKESALRHAAAAYLAQHRLVGEVEFDLIAVDNFPDGSCDVRFIPNIVEMRW